ncbi:uncharacterized protein LOC130722837 [Lotus japonicus]|uniref:uncharacterized protein LOC130722837 n=1 Tax=Lotus japonicus TaxID=34305 RepID=UPI0025872AE5|nr:uncharacterized protein LOC130722837 [Lotus japonicus]
MWGVFQRYGRVWEVFIPKKRDKGGRRFGFVRFLDVRNAEGLEWDLGGIFIGAMRIQVNRPRYPALQTNATRPSQERVVSRKPTHEVVSHVTPVVRAKGHAKQAYAQVLAKASEYREARKIKRERQGWREVRRDAGHAPGGNTVPEWVDPDGEEGSDKNTWL